LFAQEVAMEAGTPASVDLTRFGALLFDLDGVITRTATVHAAAWKRMFDDFLARWAREHDEPFRPFEVDPEYIRYIDGRRRYDGVDGFLRSRGIELEWGDPSDGPDVETVCGLGNAKNGYFAEQMELLGVDVFDDAVALARGALDAGVRIAVVSASENCRAILARAGLEDLFPTQVTGLEAAQLKLRGKPAPDTFLHAAELLGVPPAEAVVLEDAISGVQAGRAGGFGLVVGVDRGEAGDQLAANGADVVSSDLTELLAAAR
jgi:trehalose 6-phosphate phosphatase